MLSYVGCGAGGLIESAYNWVRLKLASRLTGHYWESRLCLSSRVGSVKARQCIKCLTYEIDYKDGHGWRVLRKPVSTRTCEAR